MASWQDFFKRNTGLGTTGAAASQENWPLPADLVWYPWLGLLCGLLTAGFFMPLAIIALPLDVALLLALLWQMTLVGFRAESAIFSSKPQPANLSARQVALLVILLLIKFMLMRQFFIDEVGRLLIYSGITIFCVPVMIAPSVESASPDSEQRIPLSVWIQAAVIWLAAIFWLCNPDPFAVILSPAAYRSVIIVLLAGTFSWLLMLDGKRRFNTTDGPWGMEIFAGSLAAECGALLALLASRHVFI